MYWASSDLQNADSMTVYSVCAIDMDIVALTNFNNLACRLD